MEYSGGWLKLYRILISKPIWKMSTPEQKTILITILCMVNHDSREWEWKGEKYICQPGQVVTSLKSIADASGKGISIKNVRTAIERFEKYEFLANESANDSRLVTVLNWELYQSLEEEPAKQPANGWQTGGKRVATNKEYKELKNIKNKDIYTQIFEEAYKIHPRSQAKADTFKNWNKLLKSYTEEQLLQFTQNYLDYYNSIPDVDKPFPYSSNNFFGNKAYFEDFKEPKKWEGKPKNQNKPANCGNFEQRQYSDEYYNSLYENTADSPQD